MKRWRAVLIVLATVLAGCTAPGEREVDPTPNTATGAACVRGPLVPWSSEEASPSRLSVVADGAETVVATIDVKGVFPAGVSANKVGDHAYFLSSGDVRHDVTHLIDVPGDCRARSVRLPGVVNPLGLATDGTRFFTTNTLNARSVIRRFDGGGALGATREIPEVGVTALVLDAANERLYAVANAFHNGSPDTYVLIVLDAETLAVHSRRPLPRAAASVSSAVLHDGKLIYPISYDEETREQGHSLAVLDLNRIDDPGELSAATIDLAADLPYLLRLSGDTLFVGHTFLNPAFGPISGLRHVSRVDLDTGTVSGHDLQAGIIDIDVDAGHLYLLGQPDENADTFVIETYAAADLKRIGSTAVQRPTAGGYYYPAGIISPVTAIARS